MQRRGESKDLQNQERTVPRRAEIISPEDYDAVIFELDGVITNTTELHFEAWKRTFDNLLRAREGRGFIPFDLQEFREHVDGKPRLEAIQDFLASRNITLPRGEPLPEADQALTDATDSIFGLETMKQAYFDQLLESGRLQVDDEAIDVIHKLIRADIAVGVVSPSDRTRRVLSILDITGHFDTIVDAQTYRDDGLDGKPSDDGFSQAAARLETSRDRTVIIENDRPAIEAGRGAGFGLIVVLSEDREEHKKFLRRGADLTVQTLATIKVRHNGSEIRS